MNIKKVDSLQTYVALPLQQYSKLYDLKLIMQVVHFVSANQEMLREVEY